MFIQTTLNSFIGTSDPTFIGDVRIDGYVGKRPVVLRKMQGGMLMPVLGTTIALPYGTGKVIGYSDERLLVDVTEFNDDYEFINADETEIYDASESVARRNSALRSSFNTITSDYNRLYRSEETGILPKSRQAKLDNYIPEITDTTVCVTLEGQFLKGSDKVVAQVIAKPKLTPAERRVQRALEIADAKRLRTRLLEKYDDEFGGDEVPDDAIQAELDEMFGGDDGEF
tara:strand:+ start:99 stop:782 length:684 start_codon:yes stop_codon:yes gene_type:complete